jgi:hypothetical protein
MPNTHKCSDINTNTNLKDCYTCLDSSYSCYWSDDKTKCSSFQDDLSFYNKLDSNYDASKCTKPDISLTNINDECSANADCNEGNEGKCFYNYDYENPVKKCYYSCEEDTDCSGTNEKCINRNGIPTSKKYCGVPQTINDDNNVNRTCSTTSDCNSNETCRPGFNGVSMCALKTPQTSYSSEGTNFGSSSSSSSSEYSSQIAQNQEIADQIFNDIQSLQVIEQDMFSSLDDQTLSDEKRTDIINKINSISEMRLNLYSTLNDINGYFSKVNNDSTSSMSDQSSAVKIMEEQLNKSKQLLMNSKKDKNNKIRMIEINSYYSQQYAEHSNLMKITIYTLVPIILLTFLYNNSLLPYNVFFILFVFIGLYGSFLFLNTLASIWSRDSINYQEYLWIFNKKAAPVPVVKSDENSDPWGSINVGTCIGEKCCSEGTVWNDKTYTCQAKS